MSRKILRHVEVITRHRDEVLLDTTVIRSLQELLVVPRIRFHEIGQKRELFRVASTEWSDSEGVRYFADIPVDEDFRSLDVFPALGEAIARRGMVAAEGPDGLHHYWFPVFIKDRPAACFELEAAAPLNEHQIDMAEGILGLYRNYLSLLEDSQHDTLTGLANRQTFDSSLNRLLSAAGNGPAAAQGQERRQHATQDHWLAIVDIDHFKRINDEFGHLYGDEVLIMVANLMRRSFRQQDRLFRFGGEEFVILLRKVDIAGATNTLERFRRTCENHAFPGAVGRITVSVGFARITPADTGAAILGFADEALYFAKDHGRNQVRCYERLVEAGHLRKKQFQNEVELF